MANSCLYWKSLSKNNIYLSYGYKPGGCCIYFDTTAPFSAELSIPPAIILNSQKWIHLEIPDVRQYNSLQRRIQRLARRLRRFRINTAI